MAYLDLYQQQVSLLIRVLPFIADEPIFALKGGTAINLFVRDLPRLSVDIDLTYLPVEPREASLKAIDGAMSRIADRIQEGLKGARVVTSQLKNEKIITKLFVDVNGVKIKVEITPVLRGCVYEPVTKSVSESVEARFGFAEIQVVSFADLYAGKIVAALDRQHPRDLFDVRGLLSNEGVTDELRNAFIVYMLSHNRPMAEVLAPTRKDISGEFVRGFEGMTAEPIELNELLNAREAIIASMVGDMPGDHRKFLVQFESGEPDWKLLGLPNAVDLPAVKWRQQNLDKHAPEIRNAEVTKLKRAINVNWSEA